MSLIPHWLVSLRPSRAARRHVLPLAAIVALAAFTGCAEGGMEEEPLNPGNGSVADSGTPPVTTPVLDSSTSWPVTTPDTSVPSTTTDAGTSSSSDSSISSSDASSSKPDASSSLDSGTKTDAGNPLDDLIGSFFKDSGAPAADASFTPPPEGGGEWKLNPGSFVDCPKEPPPIPIIGGLCAGIYYGCGWTNTKGQQYSCICDWIHWLCI